MFVVETFVMFLLENVKLVNLMHLAWKRTSNNTNFLILCFLLNVDAWGTSDMIFKRRIDSNQEIDGRDHS